MAAAKGAAPTWDEARPGLARTLKAMMTRIRALEAKVESLESDVADLRDKAEDTP